jgi:hypothetical protein
MVQEAIMRPKAKGERRKAFFKLKAEGRRLKALVIER